MEEFATFDVWAQSCILTIVTGVPDLGRLSHRFAGRDRDPIAGITDSLANAGTSEYRNQKRTNIEGTLETPASA